MGACEARSSQATDSAGTPNMHGPHWPAVSPAANARYDLTTSTGHRWGSSTSTTPGPIPAPKRASPGPDQATSRAAASGATTPPRPPMTRCSAPGWASAASSSAAIGVPASVASTPGCSTAPVRVTSRGPGSSGVPNERNHPGPLAATCATRQTVSALSTTVGRTARPAASRPPRTNGIRLVIGRPSPPWAREISDVSSDDTYLAGASMTSSPARARVAAVAEPRCAANRTLRPRAGVTSSAPRTSSARWCWTT